MGISSPSVFSPVLEQESGFELLSLDHIQQPYFPRNLQVTFNTLSPPEQQLRRESLRRVETPFDTRNPVFSPRLDDQSKSGIIADQSTLLQTSQSEIPEESDSRYPERLHRSVAHRNHDNISTANARIVFGDDVSGFDTFRSREAHFGTYSGKGKGRALDLDQDPGGFGLERYHDTAPSTVSGRQSESDVDGYHDSSFLRSNVSTYCPPDDLQFERNHYFRKKAQRIRRKALGLCTAIVPERCRIHGEALRYASLIISRNSAPKSSSGMATPAWKEEALDLEDSETLCGTMLMDADLVEEAGLAAEMRRRDDDSLICVEGWMGIVIVALGVVAIIMFAMENA